MRMVTVLDPECVPSDFLGEYANWRSGIEEEQDRHDQGCTNVSPGLGKFRIPGHSVSPGLLATATVTPHSLWRSLGYNCSWCQRHFLTVPDAVEVNLAGVRHGRPGRRQCPMPPGWDMAPPCTDLLHSRNSPRTRPSKKEPCSHKGSASELDPSHISSTQAQEGEGCPCPSVPQDLPDPISQN